METVFCSQVLEHVPEPWAALAEFQRVLKPGGYVILSVPHISWLHNEPHDYYRFTRHGLRILLERQGFTVVEILPAGGLFSLLGHIGSTVCMNLLSTVPGLRLPVRFLNEFWGRTMAGLDGLVDRRKLFALNYVCVGRKANLSGKGGAKPPGKNTTGGYRQAHCSRESLNVEPDCTRISSC